MFSHMPGADSLTCDTQSGLYNRVVTCFCQLVNLEPCLANIKHPYRSGLPLPVCIETVLNNRVIFIGVSSTVAEMRWFSIYKSKGGKLHPHSNVKAVPIKEGSVHLQDFWI